MLRALLPRLTAACLASLARSFASLGRSFDILTTDLRRLLSVPRLVALTSCVHTRLAYARLRPVAQGTPWRKR